MLVDSNTVHLSIADYDVLVAREGHLIPGQSTGPIPDNGYFGRMGENLLPMSPGEIVEAIEAAGVDYVAVSVTWAQSVRDAGPALQDEAEAYLAVIEAYPEAKRFDRWTRPWDRRSRYSRCYRASALERLQSVEVCFERVRGVHQSTTVLTQGCGVRFVVNQPTECAIGCCHVPTIEGVARVPVIDQLGKRTGSRGDHGPALRHASRTTIPNGSGQGEGTSTTGLHESAAAARLHPGSP